MTSILPALDRPQRYSLAVHYGLLTHRLGWPRFRRGTLRLSIVSSCVVQAAVGLEDEIPASTN